MSDENLLEQSLTIALREQARIADIAPELCGQLVDAGLGLMSPEFGGFPWRKASDDGHNAAEELEIELLRGYLGHWTRMHDLKVRTTGYASELLRTIEVERGIPVSALTDLSRSPEIDARIDGLPFATKYRRDALVRDRSEVMRDRVAEEKARQIERLELKWSAGRSGVGKAVRKRLGAVLTGRGFVGIAQRDRFYDGDYYSNGSIEISVNLEVAQLFVFPIFVNCRFSTTRVSDLVNELGGRDYFKPMELVVPGFGRHRAAMSEDELELTVFAYERLLDGFTRLAGPSISTV